MACVNEKEKKNKKTLLSFCIMHDWVPGGIPTIELNVMKSS
jgi:hypothetical protein